MIVSCVRATLDGGRSLRLHHGLTRKLSVYQATVTVRDHGLTQTHRGNQRVLRTGAPSVGGFGWQAWSAGLVGSFVGWLCPVGIAPRVFKLVDIKPDKSCGGFYDPVLISKHIAVKPYKSRGDPTPPLITNHKTFKLADHEFRGHVRRPDFKPDNSQTVSGGYASF